MSAITLYIPGDTTAASLGADRVAQRLASECRDRGLEVAIVRNGSRGAFWLEPLLEIDAGGKRIAYGPVQLEDIPQLLDDGMLAGSTRPPQCLGPVEDIPFLKQQQRLTFARQGLVDPLSVASYRAHGGLAGLGHALGMTPQAIVDEITESGLRGRGGAAFPTGIKWQTVLNTDAAQKYIVCNADEGDSGTYSDRMLMEGDPMSLLEGMIIAGLAVGATRGYIYLREEYPRAGRMLQQAMNALREAGYLGERIGGSGHRFELELRIGAGAYICGEETALLESLEGRRGMVRVKPPLPAIQGLFGQPTVVNNVISLATVPVILERGGAFYRDFGMGRSRGTLPFQLAGNIARGGLVELAFGATLRELLYDFGGGSRSGRPLRAVQVGGPLGAYLPEAQWDTPLDYEAFAAMGAMLGHGGIVAFDDSVDLREQARFAMEFCAEESCGKCTPCRIGSIRGVEVIDQLAADPEGNLALLEELCETMTDGSLCAMGGMTPYPVLSAVRHFPEDFTAERESDDSRESV
ncbi:NADH-quinone oxidoreductase subunit NuoF [Haliea sp. E1-2-M8]|uniref:formate dehydrogenase beta subunit n=1 Tax=Haliea sp. E1-2-M8 TaxID=3064706 RepID=UPI002724512D|nr:NADH-quinone oxidoreductase subunit NuoF [Haliea sp. E1-2-M8]MDO8860140.1 NADH-quinone oxidoreductase subunit NuoF [Haliea sp. E1-2-M8]